MTATVDSLPLIASSVMSKKIAAGADKILLDVKFGSGAFMKTLPDAAKLARDMVDIGNGIGRETVAMISSMEEPLGTCIGNSLEVAEAIEVLSGTGDKRLREFCVAMAARMLLLAKPEMNLAMAMGEIRKLLDSGAGLAKFQQFVVAQGGDGRVTEDPSLLGTAARSAELLASEAGYIHSLDSAELGRAAILLGAGRAKKGDLIDLTAGIKLHKRCGDSVEVGDVLATLYFSDRINPSKALGIVKDSIRFSPEPQVCLPLIAGMVDGSGWRELG